MTWTETDSERVWPWFAPFFPTAGEGRTSQVFGVKGENGVDIALPLHTPITSLTLGQVISTGWYGGGGVVCVSSQLDGIGIAAVYYQHLDTIEVSKNQIVRVGDLIGLSGGQLHGGEHPVTCCSTGPHVEIGINPPAHGIWKSLGKNIDPRPWLLNLQKNGPPLRDLSGGIPGPINGGSGPPPNTLAYVTAFSDMLAAGSGPVEDTFLGIEGRIDYVMSFLPIDWTTASKGTHWWDYVLPWQGQYTSDTIRNNLTQAISHDLAAGFFRLLVICTGLVIMLIVAAAVIFHAAKDSGAIDMAQQAAKAAPVVAAAV